MGFRLPPIPAGQALRGFYKSSSDSRLSVSENSASYFERHH